MEKTLKYEVEVRRTISIVVDVEAGSAEEAEAKVNRADFPLPPRDEWSGHKDWVVEALTDDDEEGGQA